MYTRVHCFVGRGFSFIPLHTSFSTCSISLEGVVDCEFWHLFCSLMFLVSLICLMKAIARFFLLAVVLHRKVTLLLRRSHSHPKTSLLHQSPSLEQMKLRLARDHAIIVFAVLNGFLQECNSSLVHN